MEKIDEKHSATFQGKKICIIRRSHINLMSVPHGSVLDPLLLIIYINDLFLFLYSSKMPIITSLFSSLETFYLVAHIKI